GVLSSPLNPEIRAIELTSFVGSVAGPGSEVGPWVLLARIAQDLDRLPLGVAEVGRHDHLDPCEQVARGLLRLHAAPLQPQHASARRAGCDLDLDAGPVEGRHRDGRPEGRLREGHRQVEHEVVAVALEDRVPRDAHREDEVAALPTGTGVGALAAQADLLPVLDPRRDLGVDLLAVHVEGDGAPFDRVTEAQRGLGGQVRALLRAAGRRAEARSLATETGATTATEHREDVLQVRLATAPAEGGAAPGAVTHARTATPSAGEGAEDV